MLNKLLPKSPVGIALTAASVLFAISPEARKFTRRVAVKGIAGVLSLVDQVKEMTSSTTEHINGLVAEAKGEDQLESLNTISFSYDTGIKPEEFKGEDSVSAQLPHLTEGITNQTEHIVHDLH